MRLTDCSPEHLAPLASPSRRVGLNGHEIVARRLKANGVTHVYGITGTPVDETLAACGKQGLRVIATRHQQAAVQAAAAHNYLAGGLKAVVIVSAGPGVSNCATGITIARDNHWPLLVIGGRRPLAMWDMGAFQELDGVRLFESITKTSALAANAHGLAGLLDQTCRRTMQGQPGPCYLDIAEEALQGVAEYCAAAQPPEFESEAVTDWGSVVAALRRARRPVLMLGEELRWGSPWAALARLVEVHRIPFVSTPLARGYLPDSHVLCGTRVRSWLLGEADWVLVAGASLNWVYRHGAEIHPQARLVRLAHEEDKVFQSLGRGTEYLGEPASLLRQLVEALQTSGEAVQVDEAWLRTLARHKQRYQQHLAEQCQDSALPMTPAGWLREVAGAVPEDAITIVDGNIVMAWAQHLLPAEFPLSRLTPGANGCMGVGVPFALAARLAQPDRPVLAVCGDFAIGLSIMELETAVRHHLPLVVIIANNSGSGGRLRQMAYWPTDYPERVCQFTPDIRYDQIMNALGGQGMLVESVQQVVPALKQAFASGRPTLIQINTRDDVPLPRL
jgi:2-hydroxyacyl-CoA lyase 1